MSLVQEIFTNAKTGQKLGVAAAASAAAAKMNTTTTTTNNNNKNNNNNDISKRVSDSSFSFGMGDSLNPLMLLATVLYTFKLPILAVHQHPRYSSTIDMVYSILRNKQQLFLLCHVNPFSSL